MRSAITALEQRREALVVANMRRAQFAEAKRAISTGRRPVVQVLADRDPDLAGMMLADLLMLAPYFGHRRLRTIGRHAVADQVNLMTTLGEAPVRTRAWLARQLVELNERTGSAA